MGNHAVQILDLFGSLLHYETTVITFVIYDVINVSHKTRRAPGGFQNLHINTM